MLFPFATTAAALVSYPILASAFASPSTPADTKVGAECKLEWTADATGKWTSMTIELMTGDNEPMTHMRTIATDIDATQLTSYTWVCPSVTPNSPIYFYQLSSANDLTNTQWATRFLIAGADDSSTPATQTATNGALWGLGTFTDPSQYNAKPPYFANNEQLVGGASAANGTSTASGSNSSSSPAGSASQSSVAATSPSGSATVTSAPTSAAAPTGSSSVTGSGSGSSVSKVTTSVTKSATSSAPSGSSTGTTGQSGGAAGAASATSWVVLAGAALFGAIASSL